jgi:hypothetical protein
MRLILPTFRLRRKNEEVVISSFAMLEQGKLFTFGGFNRNIVATS